MADPYFGTRETLKAEIVARIKAGEPLRRICGCAGMPSEATVRNWRAADPAFDAEVRGWRAFGREGWRGRRYSEARGRELLELHGSGLRIAEVLKRLGVSRFTFDFWLRTEWDFAGRFHAQKMNREPWRLRGLRAARTPRPFDRAVADEIIRRIAVKGLALKEVTAQPDMPGDTLIRRWRAEDADFDTGMRIVLAARKRRLGTAFRRAMAAVDTVETQMYRGHSLHSMGGTEGLPHSGTLYDWARRFPEFRAELEAIAPLREESWADMEEAALVRGGMSLKAMHAATRDLRLRRRACRAWETRRAKNVRA